MQQGAVLGFRKAPSWSYCCHQCLLHDLGPSLHLSSFFLLLDLFTWLKSFWGQRLTYCVKSVLSSASAGLIWVLQTLCANRSSSVSDKKENTLKGPKRDRFSNWWDKYATWMLQERKFCHFWAPLAVQMPDGVCVQRQEFISVARMSNRST